MSNNEYGYPDQQASLDLMKFIQQTKPLMHTPSLKTVSENSVTWDAATLNDVLERLRRLEEITAALLLANNVQLSKEEACTGETDSPLQQKQS
jgi:hypothetical protein